MVLEKRFRSGDVHGFRAYERLVVQLEVLHIVEDGRLHVVADLQAAKFRRDRRGRKERGSVLAALFALFQRVLRVAQQILGALASWPIIAMPADTMQKKLKSPMVCWRFATTWMAW